MLILPPELLRSLQSIPGFNGEEFLTAHRHSAVLSIRRNPAKYSDEALRQDFSASSPRPVLWCNEGFYLDRRPSFTFDPLFHAGAYYVQEASSMFLEFAIRETCDTEASLKALDLCAAPGGKSTLLQSVLSATSLLVCNEVIKTRVNVLTENLTKWGAANVVITNNDPKDFQRLPAWFDLIVVDAPCSGSGLFRKDACAVGEWSASNVTLCAQRQRRILSDVLPALKPGGILIYCTCSFSEAENEDIADFLGSNLFQSIRLRPNPAWNIIETTSPDTTSYGYRFFPQRLQGEGFYLSAFRKGGQPALEKAPKNHRLKPVLNSRELVLLGDWLSKMEDLAFFKWEKSVLAFPKNQLQDFLTLQSALYLKKAGISIGEIANGKLIPHHELALATLVNKNVPKLELEREDAIRYLKCEALQPDTDLRGWVHMQYRGQGLGWAKVLPTRINNYYPKAWRILSKG